MASGGLRSAKLPTDEDLSKWILCRLRPIALAFPDLRCLI
jgi:hypothetical protein